MTTEAMHEQPTEQTRFSVTKNTRKEPLRECVRDALNAYFTQLDGHAAADLYKMVIAEVEQPLLETVMHYTEGNQTQAAQVLGISRSTLRKKLTIYGLD